MMKKHLLFIVFLFGAASVFAQTTIKSQSFEGTPTTGWAYTPNPANFNTSGDVWDVVTSLSNITNVPSDGTSFWGVTDLANGNGGTPTTVFGDLSFDTVHVSGLNNLSIQFDYDIFGYDNGDDVEYEVFENGVSQGRVAWFDGSSNKSQKGTETIALTAGIDSVRFVLYVVQNGSDYAGFDNFRVVQNASVPAPKVIPHYAIGTINQDDANGESDSSGVEVELRGVVHGYDLDNGSTVQYVLIDGTGGINVRKSGGFSPSYTVTEGDSVHVWGTIGGYRGLTQLNADSMKVISSNNALSTIQKVDTVGPDVESEYIRIDTVEIISGTWPAPGNSATIEVVTPKMDTVAIRIESDLPFEDSITVAPMGKFDIIGYGGQFDFSSPYTEGYQITPHFKHHIVQHCMAPTALTVSNVSNSSADISWTTGGSNAWNIEYGTSGFTLGQGTQVLNVSTNPYQITGLTAGQTYDVYVQDTCAGNGTSAWVQASSFTTATVPSITHFEMVSNTELLVAFSDSMDATDATNTALYTGVAGLSSVALNNSNDTATLTFGTSFADGVQNTLSIDSTLSNANGVDLDMNYSFSFISNTTTPSLVINEIMYNNPSIDTLEYVEILNAGANTAVLGGLSFDAGVSYTFPAGMTLNAGAYLLVAADSANMVSVFGAINAVQWNSGALSNSGERVSIVNTANVNIDEVSYDDGNGWNIDADGGGHALILCDASSDNSDPANWGIETNIIVGLNASPGMANNCQPPFVPPLYTLAAITSVDSDGIPDSNNVQCAVEGIVTSENFSYAGASGPDVQFSITESDNSAGVWAISFSDTAALNYTPKVGDSVRAYGSVGHYNGVTQFELDSVILYQANATVPTPTTFAGSFGESDEGTLVKACQVKLTDGSLWPTVGSFAEIPAYNADGDTIKLFFDEHTNTAAMRSSAPSDWFDVTGVGSQYDRNSPYNEGHQLNVRFIEDIDTTDCALPSAPSIDSIGATEALVKTSFAGMYTIEYGPQGFTLGNGTVMVGQMGDVKLTGLTANTAYDVYIYAECDCKNSEATAVVSFTTELSTSVSDVAGVDALSAFPNPVSEGTVTLSRTADITVVNMLGNVVLQSAEATSFDVSSWPSGMYFIQETNGATMKLVVE